VTVDANGNTTAKGADAFTYGLGLAYAVVGTSSARMCRRSDLHGPVS
jgi:hypothetical protein